MRSTRPTRSSRRCCSSCSRTSRSRSPSSAGSPRARSPSCVLTSNNSRELTEALKRRCLYLWLDYPTPEHELEIVRLHAPSSPDTVARKLVEVVGDGPRARPQEAAVDRRVDRLGARAAAARAPGHRRARPSRETMSVIVKHRTDIELVAERVGARARVSIDAAAARAVGDELRREGRRDRHLRAARRVRRARRDRLARARRPSSAALAATLAKSPEDRRVFDLVFERFFFRATEAAAIEAGVVEAGAGSERATRRRADRPRRAARGRSRRRSPTATRGACATSRGSRWRRSDARTRGLGRRRHRRAAHPPRARAAQRSAARASRPATRATTGCRATPCARFEAMLRRELERAQIERTQTLPPSRPLGDLDRALPSGPAADLAAVHRVVAQLRRRLATHGVERARLAAATSTSTSAARCARRCRPAACRVVAQVPPAPPAPARDLRALRRLDERHLGLGLLPLGAARAARLVPADALVRLHRAHLRGHRHLRARAQLQGDQRGDRRRRRRRRRLRLHRLRARLVGVPRARRGRPAPARDA